MKGEEGKRYEIDLYKPVKAHFVKEGYDVYGEVNHCDVAAVKENELVIVELKLSLTMELLIQATKRQRLTDQVYIAIPKPKYSLRSKKWQDYCHLIRRLELGLIIVEFQHENVSIEIVHRPTSFNRMKSMQRSKKKRDNLLSEIAGRSGDFNLGGSHQVKVLSAYKENCIHIACCLLRNGPLSPKALREMGTGDKTPMILSNNYYGWFERIRRGTYIISEQGKSEIQMYPRLIERYSEWK